MYQESKKTGKNDALSTALYMLLEDTAEVKTWKRGGGASFDGNLRKQGIELSARGCLLDTQTNLYKKENYVESFTRENLTVFRSKNRALKGKR